LIKLLDGKLELKGGSKKEREAREWLSVFWHEAVVGRLDSPESKSALGYGS
jgi:hypothetical protein